MKFYESPPSGSRVAVYGQTVMTKLNTYSSKFFNSPKNITIKCNMCAFMVFSTTFV